MTQILYSTAIESIGNIKSANDARLFIISIYPGEAESLMRSAQHESFKTVTGVAKEREFYKLIAATILLATLNDYGHVMPGLNSLYFNSPEFHHSDPRRGFGVMHPYVLVTATKVMAQSIIERKRASSEEPKEQPAFYLPSRIELPDSVLLDVLPNIALLDVSLPIYQHQVAALVPICGSNVGDLFPADAHSL